MIHLLRLKDRYLNLAHLSLAERVPGQDGALIVLGGVLVRELGADDASELWRALDALAHAPPPPAGADGGGEVRDVTGRGRAEDQDPGEFRGRSAAP